LKSRYAVVAMSAAHTQLADTELTRDSDSGWDPNKDLVVPVCVAVQDPAGTRSMAHVRKNT
jgi:hypothetical protein